MPLPLLLGAGLAWVGGKIAEGIIGSKAADKAAKQQQAAIKKATGVTGDTYASARGYQQPLYNQGMKDYTTLRNMVNSGAYNMPNYQYTAGAEPIDQGYQAPGPYQAPVEPTTPAWGAPTEYQAPAAYQSPTESSYGTYNTPQFNFEADPGYQFRLNQGLGAIGANAAGAGTQFSGATLKALMKYGQNFASNEMANAYGRYQDTRNFGRGVYEGDRSFGRNQFAENRAFGRGAYESDRGFGRGVYESDRGLSFDVYRDMANRQRSAYEQARDFGRGSYESDRAFGRGAYESDVDRARRNYESNRGFGYGVYSDAYNQNAANLANQYNRQAALGQIGIGAAQNLSNLYTGEGAAISDLMTQSGNAAAAGTIGRANAIGGMVGGLANTAGAIGMQYLPGMNPASSAAASTPQPGAWMSQPGAWLGPSSGTGLNPANYNLFRR